MKIIETDLKWAHSLTQRVLTDTIIIHHAAGNGSVEAVHNAHLAKGWAGIAYHYYIRKDGSVYRGRPEWAVGGHTTNENYHTIGICFEGNFETENMGTAQLQAGKELLQDIKSRYPDITIKRHKDFGITACPGKNFPFDEMIKEDDEEMPVYEKITDVPKYYQDALIKLMNKGALVGTDIGDPSTIEDNIINVNETYCRIMTTLDRLGKLD